MDEGRSNDGWDAGRTDVEHLYALPPEQFIQARQRLAKELRGRGERGAAEEIQRLRKPTLPAWVLNQLSREHRRDVEDLLRASDELRQEQRRALSGGDPGRLQGAMRERRAVVDRLVEAAKQVLESHGHQASRPRLDAVSQTLFAVATEEEAASRLRGGNFEREVEHASGFDELVELGVIPPGERAGRDRGERPHSSGTRRHEGTGEQAGQRARRNAEELARRADEALQEARSLKGAADAAADDALRLRQRAERAEQEAARMRRAQERAALRAERLRRQADEAIRRVEDDAAMGS